MRAERDIPRQGIDFKSGAGFYMQGIFSHEANRRHRQIVERTRKPGQAIETLFFSAIK